MKWWEIKSQEHEQEVTHSAFLCIISFGIHWEHVHGLVCEYFVCENLIWLSCSV